MKPPFEVNRPIKLVGSCFRVKYVTQGEPTNIQKLTILAPDEEAAEKAVLEDGKSFRQERTIIATDVVAEDVYQWA